MWDKLLGFFGDGLLRKFGETPPEEWAEAIVDLNDFQIKRGFRRLRFGWKGGVPNLPDFVRYCLVIGDDAPYEGPAKHAPLPAVEGPKFDGWDIASNNRFWKYVTKRLTEDPRAWGIPMSGQQAEATCIAVAYKNAWARDMREADSMDTSTGEVIRASEEQQTAGWRDCMQLAETAIASFLQEKAA